MRNIRIIASTPKDFKIGSAVIRGYEFGWQHFFKQEVPSHFALVMEASAGSPLPFDKVFEASYGDVHCLTYENFAEQNHILFEKTFTVTNEAYYKTANWLWDQLQKPYGSGQIIQIALNKEKEGDDSKFICTELCARALEDHLKLHDFKNVDTLGIKKTLNILEVL